MIEKSRLDTAVERVYSAAAEELAGVMDVRNMYIALYDRQTGKIEFPLRYENGKQIDPKPYVEPRFVGDRKGLTDWVIEYKQPLLISRDFEAETRRLGIQVYTDIFTKSWVGAPMLRGEEVIGVIGLNNFETEGAYDEFHCDLLATIAGQAAVAIDNARLFAKLHELNAELEERVRERTDQLARLQKIGVKITSELDLEEVLEAVAEHANVIMHADFSTLFPYDAERELFEPGIRIGAVRDEPLPPSSDGLAARIARNQKTVTAENVLEHLGKQHQLITSHGLKSFVGVPLTVRGKSVGVLFVDYLAQHEFSKEEVEMLEFLANQAAVAIENARLFKQLDEAKKQAVRSTLSALAGGYVHRLNGALGFIPTSLDHIAAAVTPDVLDVLDDIRAGVEEALAYTKRMTGLFVGSDVPREPVDINILLHSVGHKLRHPDSIKLIWELMPESVEIMADKMFLTEAFNNIVINALESMEGTSIGELRIGSRLSRDGAIEAWVSDTGCGMAPQYQARIFEPEFTTKSGKRGVGLWFCDTVIKVHGGQIRVDSTLGEGTTFWVSLPKS